MFKQRIIETPAVLPFGALAGSSDRANRRRAKVSGRQWRIAVKADRRFERTGSAETAAHRARRQRQEWARAEALTARFVADEYPRSPRRERSPRLTAAFVVPSLVGGLSGDWRNGRAR